MILAALALIAKFLTPSAVLAASVLMRPVTKKADPRVLAQLSHWRRNPIQFVRENFKAEPDAWQKETLFSALTCMRIAMKACKGPGKSCVLAWLIWWFLACFPHAKILATSITGDNLRDNLWSELSLWQKKSEFLSQTFTWNAERIINNDHPETWFCSARTWPKSATAEQQASTLAGHHSEFTMIVLDESGDMPLGVLVAAEGSLSTGKKNIVVQAGNPTRTDGPLWHASVTNRKMWKVIEITGDPDDPKRSKRISKEWARNQIEQWGPDNPWVLVNVFGKFPPTASDKLLGPEEVERAQARYSLQQIIDHYPVVYGIDIAKSLGRDRSTMWKRQGPVATLMSEWRLDNPIILGNQISNILAQEQLKGIEIKAVFIDRGGLSGVDDYLIQLGWGCIVPIDFGWAATETKFANRRSEMWWNMAKWIKKNGCIPHNEILKAELTAPKIDFRMVGNKGTRFILESKEDMMDRGIPSPDLADGLALTFGAEMPIEEKDNLPRGRPRSARVLTEYDPFDEHPSQTQDEDQPYGRSKYACHAIRSSSSAGYGGQYRKAA